MPTATSNSSHEEELRLALEAIAHHQPRVYYGRSRRFTNWQNAYWELQAIAQRTMGDIGAGATLAADRGAK